VSLCTPPPSESLWKPFLWNRKSVSVQDEGIKRPLYQSWVLWGCVYAAIWVYLYWRFW
jgi:hypothetical protein